MRFFILTIALITSILVTSCMKGEAVELIIHNAQIHTMDDQGNVYEAVAIRDGKIVEVGPERQILNKYSADEYIDVEQKDVYPGFTDAHGHMLSYAYRSLIVDLVGCKSYDEMIVRLEKYNSKYSPKVITGFGWDQSLWGEKELPTNERLNEVFPDIPIYLTRVDGHASLINDALLKQSGIPAYVHKYGGTVEGGQIVLHEDGTPTGLLVDEAREMVQRYLPKPSAAEVKDALLTIQQELFSYGITGVHEAGIDDGDLTILQDLVNDDKLTLNIYGMLYPTEGNMAFAKKNGIYVKKNLLIRSFKVVGDGALGSRGAFLKEPYNDKADHHGHLTTPIDKIKSVAAFCEANGYQMNTHAIGDSTNRLLLEIHQDLYSRIPDHRWRMEHAQVIDPNDFDLFTAAGTFPSVQPSHAISDQRWAEERLGKARMKGAYAYKSLLNRFGMLAIGTDFPIEVVNPFRTIHAAVNRNTLENDPPNGFLKNEAITLEECLKGMTIWAAYASFQENELGSIEVGKDATLVVFENPVNANPNFRQNFANTTIIKGKKVYSVE